MDGLLRARGLVKRFRDRTVVAGIDLDVAAGERVALLGQRLPARRSEAMERVGPAAGYLPLPEKLRVREVLDVAPNGCAV